ncbi:MAG: glycoside hydrolase domain-containing protein [Synechococcales bacterium]|nr:glycoside hydrolase domain-containing protein [Synechococcales bacterium]
MPHSSATGNLLSVWTESSMERIGLQDAVGSRQSVQIYAARGEYEPFQIGIRASSNTVSGINVSVSDFVDPNTNSRLDRSNVTLYREHFVPVNHGSQVTIKSVNRPKGTGWYADALIPFVDPQTGKDIQNARLDATPFMLYEGDTAVIWVDVYVPPGTRSGTYEATYTVTSDAGSYSNLIQLRVWDFDLPKTSFLKSEFSIYSNQGQVGAIELLKHRLNPFMVAQPLSFGEQQNLVSQWGLQSQRLPLWSGADYHTGQMAPPPSVSTIQELVNDYDGRLFKYARFADEIDRFPELTESIKAWSRNIHAAGVNTAMTVTPNPALYDDGSGTGRSAVDIWILTPDMYENAGSRIAEVQQQGHEIWLYKALVQDEYSPKWQLDFDPINYRISQGFISQSLGITGLLYWSVDDWTKQPWRSVEMLYPQAGRYYVGEGMLVYPGNYVGVQGIVPSMRLKWIREGVEDYDYIELLKRAGYKDLALQYSRLVGENWRNWTRDPEVLESTRRQIGETLERL